MGIQSAFTNTSIFDHEYFEALFGGSKFPDGSYMIDYEEEIIEFQKIFLEVFSSIRSKNMMTFPVNTISLLFRDGKFVDEEFARWAIEHNRKWNDSNLFISESVTSLSNCCFDGKQHGLIKSNNIVYNLPFNELYNMFGANNQTIQIYHDGSWVNGRVIRTDAKQLYKIITEDNRELYATEDHIHVTSNGNKTSQKLSTNDYLKVSTKSLEMEDNNDNGSYEEGFIVGLYVGSGNGFISIENDSEYTTAAQIRLTEKNYNECRDIIQKFIDSKFSSATQEYNINKDESLYSILLIKNTDNSIKQSITQFISEDRKLLNPSILLKSKEFRKGLIDGFCNDNNGNYTIEHNIKDTLESVITSLGMQCIITNEKDLEYDYGHPVYGIKVLNDNQLVNNLNYLIKDDSLYVKIKSIETYDSNDEYVYCFEINSKDEPYFTLPNGIITHNCRLVSNVEKILEEKNIGQELGWFSSIGGTSLSVGSVKCSTINFARIAIESNSEEEYLEKLKEITKIDLMALDRVRYIITRNVEKGILHNFTYNLIDFKHLYNTIGQ